MVHRRHQDLDCRNSWAFALTGAVLHALQLAYLRLGNVSFEGHHMSIEYLTSCYESPGKLCGCFGADLCTALLASSQHGMVSFRQAPYVSTTADEHASSPIDVPYYCHSTTHNGTCPPCAPSQADYVERVTPAGSIDGAARFTVECFPCNQPRTPRYFPHEPFHLLDPAWSHAEKVASVKAELRRIGPLAAALPIDDDALLALLPGQQLVNSPESGLVYKPINVRKGVYHSALIVGYVDVDPVTAVWICRATWIEAPWFGYAYEVPDASLAGEAPHLGVIDRMFNVRMYDDPGADIVNRVVSFESVRILSQQDESPRVLSTSDPMLRGSFKAAVPQHPRISAVGIAALVLAALIVAATLLFFIAHSV